MEKKKDYLMVYYYESRGSVGIREKREVSLNDDEIVEFIWNFMNEYYEGGYEESLSSWLDEESGKRENFEEFLKEGEEIKDGCVIYEVNEEESIVLIENGKDGDEEERPELSGCYSVQATSNNKPGIVDAALNPIMDANEIYSGAYYRASIRAYAWDHPTGGKGVSIALDNVMKVKDGEAFSGRTDASADFADFAKEDADLLG